MSEYGSHIVLHMVKSKHKEIELHPESPLKDATLECHCCKGNNMFLLGFMPAKVDAYLILLCREPCLRQLSVKESAYDTDNWQPLIKNKALLEWICNPPSELEFKRSRKIKPQQINRLEELWKEKPKAGVEDLSVVQPEKA